MITKQAFLTSIVLISGTHLANGADWIGGIGNWSNPENWAGGLIPGADDHAVIYNGGTAILDHLELVVGSATFGIGLPNGERGDGGLIQRGGSLYFDEAGVVTFGSEIETAGSLLLTESAALRVDSALRFGFRGNADVQMNGGSSLITRRLVIAGPATGPRRTTSATANVDISGEGTVVQLFNTSNPSARSLFIGGGGSALVTVRDGAVVETTSAHIYTTTLEGSTVHIDGPDTALRVIGGTTRIGRDSFLPKDYEVGEVTLTLTNGGVFDAQAASKPILIEESARINGTGSIRGDAVLLENAVIDPGHGDQYGFLTFTDQLETSFGGTLHLDIGSTTDFDTLSVHDLIAGGILEVAIADDFVADFGQSFDIINADTLTGDFDLIVLPELDGSLFFQADIHAQGVTLHVVPAPAMLLALALPMLARARRRAE